MMDKELLGRAAEIAEQVLRPRAADADRCGSAGPVADNVRRLGAAGFLGLAVPRAFGGLEADEATRHEYAEILAAACGVTAFTQQQLHTSAKFLADCANEVLKRRFLPQIAVGRLRCGIAISHLRRPGPPMMQAERTQGGYRLSGVIPWITGWSLLDGFVLGATLPDGDHVFVYIDGAVHADSLHAGPPMDLSVMGGSDTVQVHIGPMTVSEECVLQCQPSAALQRYDLLMLTAHAALPLGCARAAARVLHEMGAQPGREDLAETALALTLEISQCRREALTWNCDCISHPEYGKYALRARASAIVLAMRAAFAAVAASGGRAHLVTATPQRLMREAQFYATAVQTPEIQAATLDQLISPFFGR